MGSLRWPNGEDINVGLLHFDVWIESLTTLKHGEDKEKVAIDLANKSLAKFIEFRNMKDMMVGGDGCRYCEESPLNCECETKSGQPCCILEDIMHGDAN